jgi:predicted transcriptional regulator
MEILKALWEHGPASVRQVCKSLALRGDDSHFNTVQTLLRLMEGKGLVTHQVEGRAFIYAAAYSREQSVRGFLDRVFDGAADQLVLTLLRQEMLSPQELTSLQAMIQEARKKKDR